MKRIIAVIVIIFINIPQFSCSDNNEEQISAICDNLVIIDSNTFQNGPDDDWFEITNAEIENDCLSITIQSGGCNNGTWKVNLVDADRILETAIPQRDLRIFLENNEPCNAINAMTISFELTPLRTSDKVIMLNLEKWNSQIEYSY